MGDHPAHAGQGCRQHNLVAFENDGTAGGQSPRCWFLIAGRCCRLLKDGYKTAMRPSQHEIGPHFQRDNGGAIPPNLLTIPNTRSNDEYLHACRAAGVTIHPRGFPPGLPEFFIRFLTEPGQTVLDPFAGSNVTGRAAETLGRGWISVEINEDYIAGSRLRFGQLAVSSSQPDSAAG